MQTLSIGVAVFAEHGQTSTAILMAADVALYHAKQAGRNRVVVAGFLLNEDANYGTGSLFVSNHASLS